MKIFVIHRSTDRKNASKKIKTIAKNLSISIQPIFLDSSKDVEWKLKAEDNIRNVEAIILFNSKKCETSENTKWEIDKAKTLKKDIIIIEDDNDNLDSISLLKSLYDLKKEFATCFPSDKKGGLELYKLMIDSSEKLIQRRQNTNAFFITVIGSLLTIAGLLVKSGALNTETLAIVYGFSVIGLLLCNSWRNLIDNYGKLNKAKFDVILRLEKDLDAQIYFAEWIALGKGLRPKKYKSFTETEKNVPIFFGILIIGLTLAVIAWQIWGDCYQNTH